MELALKHEHMGALMMGGTNKPFSDLMKIIEFFKAHAMGLFIFSCFSCWGVVKNFIISYFIMEEGNHEKKFLSKEIHYCFVAADPFQYDMDGLFGNG
jgi:hypothetical protein